jgi:predicted acylesterase/phospholipase RssA
MMAFAKNEKKLKRAITLAGRGPAAGIHIGVLQRLRDAGIEFDVWSLSCVGAWVGIIYNQADKGREIEETYDFFHDAVFRDDASYRSFPVNQVFLPDWFGNTEALIEFLLKLDNYRGILSPKKVGQALAETLYWLFGKQGDYNEGDINRWVLNQVLSVNPVVRFWTSMLSRSNITGLSRIYYPNSDLLNTIRFTRLYESDKPYIYHNAWNISKQEIQLFSNKGGAYKPITAASVCACSSLPFIDQPVEIDGDQYCEGTLIDTVNFEALLQDHPDLDEIWVLRIADAQRYRKPENLHDALGNLCQQYEATLAEGDIELFKYHVKESREWSGRIVEVQVNSDVSVKEDHENLNVAVATGQRAGDKACSSYFPEPSFFFALEGEGARGGEALWGAVFDLVFCYDVLSTHALVGLQSQRFKRLIHEDTRAVLGIDIVPKGLALMEGGAGRVVRFERGKMVDERPRFRLKAPEQGTDTEPDPRGVYVIFTIAGAVIYDFFLRIRLVEQFADSLSAPRILDLDLEELANTTIEEPRIAGLRIKSKGGHWELYGNIDGIELTPISTTVMSEARLEAAYYGPRGRGGGILDDLTKIAGDAVWKSIDEDLKVPKNQKSAAQECTKLAIAVGAKLYRVFSADPAFKEVLDRIEELPDGSKITIMTDTTVFPWELLYPLKRNDRLPPRNYEPEKFWGRRFLFESLLLPTEKAHKPPKLMQQPGKLHVTIGVNSKIDADWTDRPLLPVALHKEYFNASLSGRGTYFEQHDEIMQMLSDAHPTSMIYFFCHGAEDQLQFGHPSKACTSAEVMGPSYPGWPIVFLNACSAGNISPLSFLSFRTEFRERKAVGLIAPSFPIPTLFAALFAKTFLQRYAERQPIGRILFNLRRELLAKENPLGLWYSLQAPLDVKAPAG